MQKSTLNYLNTAISSDRFFQKLESLLSIEEEKKIVMLVLGILELMCSNNNMELQVLLRY